MYCSWIYNILLTNISDGSIHGTMAPVVKGAAGDLWSHAPAQRPHRCLGVGSQAETRHFFVFLYWAEINLAAGWTTKPNIHFEHYNASSMITTSACASKVHIPVNMYNLNVNSFYHFIYQLHIWWHL